jgi:hypothetical protein
MMKPGMVVYVSNPALERLRQKDHEFTSNLVYLELVSKIKN